MGGHTPPGAAARHPAAAPSAYEKTDADPRSIVRVGDRADRRRGPRRRGRLRALPRARRARGAAATRRRRRWRGPTEGRLPPEPRLQTAPAGDLAALREEEQRALGRLRVGGRGGGRGAHPDRGGDGAVRRRDARPRRAARRGRAVRRAAVRGRRHRPRPRPEAPMKAPVLAALIALAPAVGAGAARRPGAAAEPAGARPAILQRGRLRPAAGRDRAPRHRRCATSRAARSASATSSARGRWC